MTSNATKTPKIDLKRFYAEAPVGLCHFDIDLRYIHINEWLAAINGVDAEKHVGRTIGEVLPDVAATVEPQLRHVIESGQAYVLGVAEVETPAHPGEKRQYETSYYPVKSDDGTVTGVSCVVQDVDNLKRSREDLQQAQDRFRRLLEATPDAMVIADEAGKIVLVNGQTEKLLGYSRDELIGTTVEMLLPERFRNRHAGHRSDYSRNPVARPMGSGLKLFARCKDGREFPAEISLSAIDIEEASLVLSSIRDVTEHEQREEELRNSREQFRALLETTRIIPWKANANTNTFEFTYVGPQAVEILGYPLERWFEIDFWSAHIHPDDREDAVDFCVRTSNSKDQYEFEYRMVASDGRIVWLTDLVSVVRKKDSKKRALQGFMIDITERKRSELFQAGHNRILEMVAEGKILPEVLDELACVIEEQHDQEVLCSILLLDEQEAVLRHGAGPSLPEEHNRAMDGIAVGPCAGSCGTAAHRKKRVIVKDTFQDPLWKDFRELAQRFNLRACWSEPILSRHGQVRGTIAVYRKQAHGPSNDDISLIEKIAPLAAVAIEHARAQEKLRDLGGRLISSQEDERRRIARELHDDFNQRLSLLSIELERASRRPLESPARTSELMQDLSNRAKRLSTDIHRLSHQLHPAKLEHLGLVAAVRSFCRELSEHEGTRIEFTHREVPTSIPRDVALCIYRTAQEALRNVVKHSDAGEALAELTGGPDEIRLQISDSGAGFEPASVNVSSGLGLISMQERLRLVGGKISIQSQPSRGTRIDVRVPLSVTGY